MGRYEWLLEDWTHFSCQLFFWLMFSSPNVNCIRNKESCVSCFYTKQLFYLWDRVLTIQLWLSWNSINHAGLKGTKISLPPTKWWIKDIAPPHFTLTYLNTMVCSGHQVWCEVPLTHWAVLLALRVLWSK